MLFIVLLLLYKNKNKNVLLICSIYAYRNSELKKCWGVRNYLVALSKVLADYGSFNLHDRI